MKVSLEKNSDLKTIRIVKNLQGRHFSIDLAGEIFDLEDQGYTVTGTSKKTIQKLQNMRVAFYRVK